MKPPSLRRFRAQCAFFFALVILTNQGCYHYRITSPNPDPSTEFKSKTLHNWCWGLIQAKDVQPQECADSSNGLDQVVFSTNLGYTLLTTATLGIWCPVKMKWRCHKPCPRTGELTIGQ